MTLFCGAAVGGLGARQLGVAGAMIEAIAQSVSRMMASVSAQCVHP